MKHFAPNSSEAYYRARWRAHTVRFIAALAVFCMAVTWGGVALFYGSAAWVIAAAVVAILALFIAAIKYRDCDRSYDRVLRSIIHPEDILDDTDTTDHP